jgi:hypothetical protein
MTQMLHRHLLPPEIDLLVDGDAGFGVAPLRAHAESCDDCRARLEAVRAVALRLDELPHFTPRLGFADRVLAQVQVIEPWHVALREGAARLVPQSVPMRILAVAGATVGAVTISGSALWLAFRADLAAWTYGVAADRAREGVVALLSDLAGAAVSSAGSGVAALGVATLVLAATTVAAVLGFRRLAAVARARQG